MMRIIKDAELIDVLDKYESLSAEEKIIFKRHLSILSKLKLARKLDKRKSKPASGKELVKAVKETRNKLSLK